MGPQDVPENVAIACPQGSNSRVFPKRTSPLIGASNFSHNFHGEKKKNESHLCNSLIFSVAGPGIEPGTS